MRTSHAVILVLGAALAAGTLVLTGSRPDEAAIPPDIELEARPERSRAPTLATPPPPPKIERDSHEWRLLLALSVNNSKQREWALEQILTAGTAHPQVLEALEALLEREGVKPSILCPTMHAVMLLKGNRDHVRRMAELGSSSPFGTCATHLAALDPSSGAFIARAAWLAARGADNPKPPPALVRAAGQWFELALVDPIAARHAVLERLASAPHEERAWLVPLALALRPLPSEVPGYVESLLEAGTPAEQVRALGACAADPPSRRDRPLRGSGGGLAVVRGYVRGADAAATDAPEVSSKPSCCPSASSSRPCTPDSIRLARSRSRVGGTSGSRAPL